MKNTCQRKSKQRHDSKLVESAQNNAFRHFHDADKIMYAHGCAHAKHDELQKRRNQQAELKSVELNKALREIHRGGYGGKDYRRIRISFERGEALKAEG